MKFIKQCKGKDLGDIPKSKLLNDGWFLSTKYDGNYVQIQKFGDKVMFFTSGEKEFYIPEIAKELISLNPDCSFTLECEYIGTSEGKLGDRTKVGKLTTYRTDYEKCQQTKFDTRERFKVFDIIIPRTQFSFREPFIQSIKLGTYLEQVYLRGPYTLEKCKSVAKELRSEGWEGAYIKHKTHLQEAGKRVNTAAKLKERPTADLLCIDIIGGTGKYQGQIGSLVLQDSKGRTVAVGSGLSDFDRAKNYNFFIGKVIEVEYEQLLDTYIQPTYLCIREDKSSNDIN